MQRITRTKTPGDSPTPHERARAKLYGELNERYKEATILWALPMIAIRLYAKRVGLDSLLRQLDQDGVAVVGERCRNEMVERQHFLAEMLARFPALDPQEGEDAIAEMAEDLAVIDSADGALLLLRFLDRLLTRERLLKLGDNKVTR